MHERLLDDFRAGRMAALARVISIVENHRDGYEALLAQLHAGIGHARRIGVTGPPGAGKSTVTAHLARRYRSQGLRVGIVCVDPTSPFTGGALLGDRIRMEEIALDPGVYIRSLATRGSLGGLSAATRDVCDVLDAFGVDRVLIETVGVGQSELDVARMADTSLVVLVPESGDSIQTLKAGLMEIADIFAVNKADRPGADRLRADLEVMLGMRGGRDSATRTPAVLRLVAVNGEGVPELIDALDEHFHYLETSGTLRDRRRARLRERVVDMVGEKTRRRLWTDAETVAWLDARLPDLEAGRETPFAVADALLARSADLLAGGERTR